MGKPLSFEEFIRIYPAGHPLHAHMCEYAPNLAAFYKQETYIPYLLFRQTVHSPYRLYRAPWWRRILDRIAVWRENRRFPEGAAPFW